MLLTLAGAAPDRAQHDGDIEVEGPLYSTLTQLSVRSTACFQPA